MANTPQFSMRLDTALRRALEAIAAEEHRSLSNLIERICDEYVRARGAHKAAPGSRVRNKAVARVGEYE
jgi:hypothetical protein